MLRNATAVQCLSQPELRDLIHRLPLSNIVLIPNGQDLAASQGFIAQFKNKEPVFGFCGRLDRYHKGLDILLAAFSHYRVQGGTGRLELIGDGQDRRWLEKHAEELGIQQTVVFHGAQFGEHKFRLIASYDCFLHPSRMEGFPTAVLEAAGMGLPCITTVATGINDYLIQYQAGFTIENLQTEALVQALLTAEKAFHCGVLPGMGARARDMVQSCFDWKMIAQQLTAVYAGKLPQVQFQ